MSDWLIDLKFWCQTNGAKREVACNHDDAERVQAAAAEAGLADLVDVQPTYIIPRGHAWVPRTNGLDEGFYQALRIRRWM